MGRLWSWSRLLYGTMYGSHRLGRSIIELWACWALEGQCWCYWVESWSQRGHGAQNEKRGRSTERETKGGRQIAGCPSPNLQICEDLGGVHALSDLPSSNPPDPCDLEKHTPFTTGSPTLRTLGCTVYLHRPWGPSPGWSALQCDLSGGVFLRETGI